MMATFKWEMDNTLLARPNGATTTKVRIALGRFTEIEGHRDLTTLAWPATRGNSEGLTNCPGGVDAGH
jgi:hypothetical protein